MIVAVDFVAANAAIDAIWLVSHAQFEHPPDGMGVKVTWGIVCSS